ncbi:Beta-mannosyltransferase 1 [Candida viswanathii]|uniref:Beta-mannosyltransferase 1 n=1 Tax=Candida viswanathii TaxID=5486 RepID=A0A367YG23_9ASCO|nr:Beta-mannosyltransferase 1 [Candida viswanathii]
MFESFKYSKLTNYKHTRIRNIPVLVLLFIIASLSILAVLINLNYERLQVYITAITPTTSLANPRPANPEKRTVIFPSDFHLPDSQIVDFYINDLLQDLDPEDVIYRNRASQSPPSPSPEGTHYTSQPIELFHATNGGPNTPCRELSNTINVGVSPAYSKDTNLTRVVERFVAENSTYFNELVAFFPEVHEHLSKGVVEKHWFRLIGSSVWLKQYGVHLMASRVVYSSKNQGFPQVSLTYLQVFDSAWNELENVDLVVPNDDDDDDDEGVHGVGQFRVMRYPRIAPVPIFHDITRYTPGKPIGVEDPRIQVVTNARGHEEPVIVFNAHHRRIDQDKTDWLNEYKVRYVNYRSIFVGWLWRTQRGKFNLEEMPNPECDAREYVKVREMEMPGQKRGGSEKNWALILDSEERAMFGYDKHFYFVYLFENLKVLKCPIDEEEVVCEWAYKANDVNKVGLFHGGTELVNINQMLEEHTFSELDKVKKSVPEGRQIWIGFARAVMLHCGCGTNMYRPNLVILMKDIDQYKVAHVSPFLDLGIEVLPWFENGKLCDAKNLIIPNGISSWTIERLQKGRLMDTMAFTITRRDATVDLVYMQGLLDAVLSAPDLWLFEQEQRGFRSDDHINCALAQSEQFCKAYGIIQKDKEG